MCYWILNEKGKVITRTTIQRVKNDDLESPMTKERMSHFNTAIKMKLSKQGHVIQPLANGLVLDDEESDANNEPEQITFPDQDNFTDEAFDAYLRAELMVPHRETYIQGWVMKRLQDDDGNPIGQWHTNPLLNMWQYEVQFGDGLAAEYTMNLIAENLFTQCDPEGKYHLVFKEIVDMTIQQWPKRTL